MPYPFSRVNQRTIRFIANANHKPPALQPLAATFGALSALNALESVTSGRLTAEKDGLPGIAPADLAKDKGRTYINAAFAYPRPRGNRFNPDAWCAWYSAFDVDTGLAEVAFHLTRALTAAGGDYDNETRYIELHATFDADFCDLRAIVPPPGCLDADVATAYPLGQQLATDIRVGGGNGIVYPSARKPGGTCLVAFWPGLVGDLAQGKVWTLKWTGDPTPTIT